MVRCERCQTEHDGNYGSGRFCSSQCSRSFSTLKKREAINRKVSKKLRGKDFLSVEERARIGREASDTKRRKLLECDFDLLTLDSKKKRVILEQDGKCIKCGLSEWMGEILTIHVDHIDGNTSNNRRSNLRGLCPNCHSLTPTYCGRNGRHITDEELLKELSGAKSIAAALTGLGKARNAFNYERCRNLMLKNGG